MTIPLLLHTLRIINVLFGNGNVILVIQTRLIRNRPVFSNRARLEDVFMKKLLLIILSIILIITLIFVAVKFGEKRTVEKHFENYLKEHSYLNDISSRETNYDFKLGKFYTRAYYKKYPERTYEYHYFSRDRFFGTAYEKGTEIDTTDYLKDAKYPNY